MLARHLPFDSNDDKEIGRKTIYQEITFSHSLWDGVSNTAKDLVSKLLNKSRERRITIRDTLDHPWFNFNGEISKMRLEAKQGGDELMKFISYSNHDANMVRQVQR
jgi:serine/threonine protein kinase